MGEVVWINGRVHGRAEALVSAFDHGFLYGDSIYETVRTSHGRPFLLDRHLARLRRSATSIELGLSQDDATLGRAIDAALTAAANPESALRIVATRGIGDIGYGRELCASPTVLIYARPLASIRDPALRAGIDASILEVRRNDRRAVSPSIKSSNLLNNILGAREAQKKGAYEGIMLNHEGDVAEGTMTNVFVVRSGRVETPPESVGILPGITRGFVLDLAHQAGIPAGEARFGAADLLAADEAFFTGTTRGILPIVKVDGRAIGNGRPGPLTTRLTTLFDAAEDRLAGVTAAPLR
jgi:branched-chain amino acid aminotransferase